MSFHVTNGSMPRQLIPPVVVATDGPRIFSTDASPFVAKVIPPKETVAGADIDEDVSYGAAAWAEAMDADGGPGKWRIVDKARCASHALMTVTSLRDQVDVWWVSCV